MEVSSTQQAGSFSTSNLTSLPTDFAKPGAFESVFQDAQDNPQSSFARQDGDDHFLQSDAPPQDTAPSLIEGNGLVASMVAIMTSTNFQVLNLTLSEPLRTPIDPQMLAASSQIMAYVEKTDAQSYLFKIQGQALEIKVEKSEMSTKITLFSKGELKTQLVEMLPQLSEHLKTKIEEKGLEIDVQSLYLQDSGGGQSDEQGSEQQGARDDEGDGQDNELDAT